jgi:hypothetical protein
VRSREQVNNGGKRQKIEQTQPKRKERSMSDRGGRSDQRKIEVHVSTRIKRIKNLLNMRDMMYLDEDCNGLIMLVRAD